MPKRFARQYHFDTDVEGVDERGWSQPEYFDNIADLYVEVQELWNCEEFSMELETWCEQANIGDVFEDDDIRVTVMERPSPQPSQRPSPQPSPVRARE